MADSPARRSRSRRPSTPLAGPLAGPLAEHAVAVRQQLGRLQREADQLAEAQQLLAAIAAAWEKLRGLFKPFPELRPLVAAQLGVIFDRAVKANPVPDGAVMKVARATIEQEIVDALDAMIEDGTLDVLEHDTEEGKMETTRGELETLKRRLLPRLYRNPPPAPEPTGTAPGSEARQQVYAQRAEDGFAIHHPDDAAVDLDDRRGLVVRTRANGSTIKNDMRPIVEGWGEEKIEQETGEGEAEAEG